MPSFLVSQSFRFAYIARGGILMEHEITLINKSSLTVTAVTSVDGFDETAIYMNLEQQGLNIFGENLHIESLDLDEGRLVASGTIENIQYTKKKTSKSIWERFKK